MGGEYTRADLERALDGDLVAALGALGVSPAAATPVSGEGYPGYRPAAYRIETLEGRVLKGRLFNKPANAELAEQVAAALPARIVPAALARSGRALITEWVDGPRPEGVHCTTSVLRHCGEVQAFVHRQPIPEREAERRARRLQAHSNSLRERIDLLIAAAVLDADEGTRAGKTALSHVPSAPVLGFILGDFCPENSIVRDSGEVCFVDHETLAIDYCDYDLARTWYRWPMTPAQRSAFFAGYDAKRSVQPFLSHFPFWAIAVLVGSAWYRHRRHEEASAIPLARLRALLADLEGGRRPEEIVYRS